MITTLRTLFQGANARAEDRVRDAFALDLIDQKIRETEAQVKAAKTSLATLIQRQRSEARMLDGLQGRIDTMLARAQAALDAGREDMATQAAEAVARMENEAQMRRDTLARLDMQATRLRASVETAHRRIVDLKQGAITARAIRREHQMQGRLKTTLHGQSSADEAEALIARVIGEDDPLESAEILAEINDDLSETTLETRMADAGFGPATKVTGAAVLARVKTA